ncbi:Macrolide export ATP-binding/permease protein MacB [Planctomycetes bacterium Poly30]|uniref:Macrolide export ATP-binding/permease protein MacB n=1 Tax=Saltatorellus ferox TaxID=2528018 RepID=A0A518ESZ6_9BACT|nr:Macrolide export ATP-binding/permease protein MacB [Planctomycetes bacterium Poly30]
MSTWFLIVTRSMREHALSTSITVLAAALAGGLVMAVLAIHSATSRAFGGMDLAYDAILGPAGGQSQLVLNTLFHLDASQGNIPWSLYRTIANDPGVERAVPYAVGDNFRGFRIIGTTLEAFEGRSLVEPGTWFDPGKRQAVVGAAVARETGLARGSTFSPSHGLTYDERDPRQHAERYAVVGVMAPTGTPDDRVIFIPIEGVYRMGGHELRGSGEAIDAEAFHAQEIPDAHKEVSAVLLRFRRGGMSPGLRLNRQFNVLNERVTLAWPIAQVLADLYRKLFWAIEVLRTVAGIVVVVAGAGLLASLYNTMSERRRELAVFRALGARRGLVFGVVVGEAVAIAALGSLLGFAVYGAILSRVRDTLLQTTGVVLVPTELGAGLLWVPIGMLGVGVVAGLLPAMKAYTTDPCRTLARSL